MDHLPWIEKYRPTRLVDVVSHESALETIRNLLSKNNLPHLLIHGPPGTGKTSTVLALAQTLFGKQHMHGFVLELNASDERGIDVVRERIKVFANTASISAVGELEQMEQEQVQVPNFKLIILDEVDMMTSDAQFALRRIVEMYTLNARFCLICNYVHKIIPALQSRCLRLRFAPLSSDHVQTCLESIVWAERVAVNEAALKVMSSVVDGDARKAINLLQACHLSATGQTDFVSSSSCSFSSSRSSASPITPEMVYAMCGKPSDAQLDAILHLLIRDDLAATIEELERTLSEDGFALQEIVTGLHKLVRAAPVPLPEKSLAYLLEQLAEIEVRLATDSNERVQLRGLVGVFRCAQETFAAAEA
jgi:replication factor C subunit 3/5